MSRTIPHSIPHAIPAFTFIRNRSNPSTATKRKHITRRPTSWENADMKHNMFELQTLHDFAGNIWRFNNYFSRQNVTKLVQTLQTIYICTEFVHYRTSLRPVSYVEFIIQTNLITYFVFASVFVFRTAGYGFGSLSIFVDG